RFHADRAGLIRAHAPAYNAEGMITPVANEARAEVHHPAEVEIYVCGVVRPPPGRAEPHIPVKVGRRGLFLSPTAAHVDGMPNLDVIHFPDLSVANKLRRIPRITVGTPLRPELNHALVLFGSMQHRIGFLNG